MMNAIIQSPPALRPYAALPLRRDRGFLLKAHHRARPSSLLFVLPIQWAVLILAMSSISRACSTS